MNIQTSIALFRTEKGGYFAAVDRGPAVVLQEGTGLYVTKEETKDGKTYLRLSIFGLKPREPEAEGRGDNGDIPF